MTNLVHNERLKLAATALNSAGVASGVAGFITPLVAASFGFSNGANRGLFVAALTGLIWLLAGLVLHYAARSLLGGLKE